MADRRVVITGVGPVTPIGIGLDPFWCGLQAARSVVRSITRFDSAPFRSHIAAEVDGFEPADWIEPRRAKRLDRCSQFTLAGAKLAIADAGLELAKEDLDRVGAMMGTALGGVAFAEAEHGKYVAGGIRAVEPGLALTVFVGASSCNLAIELGVSAITPLITTRCNVRLAKERFEKKLQHWHAIAIHACEHVVSRGGCGASRPSSRGSGGVG